MRLLSIIVLIIIVLLTLGYAVVRSPAEQNNTVQNSTSTVVSVSTSTIQTETADYTVNADYPQFGIPAVDAAIKNVIVESMDSLTTLATKDQPAKNDFPKYAFDSTFTSPYVSDDIVSVRIVTSMYTGGAHGMPSVFGMNFDRRTGRELAQDDALRMIGLSLEQIAAEAKRQLTEKYGGDIIAPEGADATPDNYQAFYITKDSVVFIFQPYQVTPYAAGAPEVSFPRTQ